MTAKWTVEGVYVNIPDNPVEIYYAPDPRFEVVLEPYNGYDDGRRHEDRLYYVVSVYERTFYDADNDEWTDAEVVWSRRHDTKAAARCGLLEAAVKCGELMAEAEPLEQVTQ